MIKFLDSIAELKFPIATMEKTNDLHDDNSYIYYKGQALLKREDLLSTFNINEEFLPTTYSLIHRPETLFSAPSLTNGKLIIDSRLNTFLPIKRIKLEYYSATFIQKFKDYIKVKEVCHLLYDCGEKYAKYPLLCKIVDLKTSFLVGWTDEKVKPYETFI